MPESLIIENNKSNLSPQHSIVVDRPIITQKSFNQVFIPTKYEDRTPGILCDQIRNYAHQKCIPSRQCGQSYLKRFLPFLSWLKIYQIGWLPSDIICGLTIAIMQIPQGMAYALLANLPAIIGLYISFFPALVYAFFGTSRHISMGAVAVISLMTGNVVDRLNVKPIIFPENSTAQILSVANFNDPTNAIRIATTLACTAGLIQLILSICRLGFVTSFFSDAFISGYTTGTAVLVFTSQITDIFGLTIKRYVGPLNIVYTYIDIFANLKNTNVATLIISICSIVVLVIVKEYLDPLYKKHIKRFKIFRTIQIPIPIELFVIIAGTLASYLLDLNGRYRVRIVKTINSGFQAPQAPSLTLMPSVLKDAVIISVVSFSICISLAKTYAKKFKYTVDSNQELAAYGLCNIIGSFFSCFASAASLSRTSVYVNSGGKTQFASLISCVFLLIIILKIGPLFEPLPKACLASIIVVALKGLFLQTKDIFTIGRVTKLESIVWIVTFLSTVILDVDYGLIVGVVTSIIVVIIRQFRPRTTILGQYERTEVYQDAKRYSNVHEISPLKIFRFESPITYFNADYFRESLLNAVGINVQSGERRRSIIHLRQITHIIIDCASINQIDYSGGKIFLQTLKELNSCHFNVFLCNLRYYNYDVLEKLNMDQECSVTITATVHDAVHKIQDNIDDNHEHVQRPPSEDTIPSMIMRF